MTDELLLLARDTAHGRTTATTHASRLRERTDADRVATAYYGTEPAHELASYSTDADRVYAVPLVASWSYAVTEGIPSGLAHLDATVHHCEPVGRNPAVTDALLDRIEAVAAESTPSVVLAGLGSSSLDRSDTVVETHAQRLRADGRFDAVTTAYLLQNPAVECARYNVSGHAVAAPVFVVETPASSEQIPAALDLDRGGLAYADPLGDHLAVTDAIYAEFQRLQAIDDTSVATTPVQPVATDGRGPVQ